MTAATGSTAGTAGLVPAPQAGAQDKFLRGDGTWVDLFSEYDAMVFKGIVIQDSDLPASGYSAGWTYRAAADGIYKGEYCEVGDLIIAINDYDSSTASNADWAKIEHNIDGALFMGHAGSALSDGTKLLNVTGGGVVTTSSSTVGSLTKPVFLNAGTLTETTYSLNATINSGTANQVAYYSSANTIDSMAPAWQPWTAGSTSGPQANIQIGNAIYQSAAIPSATATDSGIVTTAAQTFAGNKTFQGDVLPQDRNTYDLGSSSLAWKDLYVKNITFDSSDTSTEANRLVWTDSNKLLKAANHYADATSIAINSTTIPTPPTDYSAYNLYINGDARSSGDLYFEGTNNKLAAFKLTTVGTVSRANIDMGWDWEKLDGAGAAFRSTDPNLAANQIGRFVLFARTTANDTTQLIGAPTGELSWKKVSGTARMGINADANANYNLYVNGNAKIESSPADDTPLVTFVSNTTPGTNGYQHGLHYLVPNMVSNSNAALYFGKAASTGNAACLQMNWVGDNHNNNFFGLGFWAVNNLVRIYKTGNVSIGEANNNYKLYVNGTSCISSNLTVDGTIYFGANTSGTTGKPVLAYNASNTAFGITYYEGSPDVMTFSASSNANNKTNADFSINGLGDGVLSNRGNRIPHTGNTTGTVGSATVPVYVNAGKITQGSYALNSTVNAGTANYMAYYSGANAISATSGARISANTNLSIWPSGSSPHYSHGLRIHSLRSWSGILLCGDDNTADTGTSANSWWIGNNNGTFYINKNGSTAAANTRVMATSTGWTFGNTSRNSYALNCASFICDSWVRTVGSTGWYNESYSGGWYMSDSTWIRVYNNKSVYTGSGTIRSDNAVWGNKVLVNADWIGYYAAAGTTTTRYGYVQCNANRMYFRKENGVSSYHFDFNGHLYTTGTYYTTAQPGVYVTVSSGQWAYVRLHNSSAYWDIATNNAASGTAPANSLGFRYNGGNLSAAAGVWITPAQVLMGAAWNDYAEYRETKEEVEAGRCVREVGDDTLELTTKRLERGCEIVSDTYGFVIGKTEKCQTPIASSGRVLAYGYEPREEFAKHIGWPVCSGPNGTVSIMTEEEEEKYPSRIIGTISAVPDYEEWGTGNVKVNGRVWIRIR